MKGADSTRSYLQLETFSARRIRNFHVLPVSLGEDLGAVIALGYAGDPPADHGDLRQATQVVGQVAIGLKSARLLERLNKLSWGTLMALGRSMDAKSEWTAGHTERVTALALSLGRRLDLSDRQLEVLRQGALVHDIGKVGVPGFVLDKPGKLETEEEIQAIRAHPRIGAKILAPIAPFADVIPLVLHHHERYDGGGYPDGLAGEEIPHLARVLAVVDVYDALVSARPYREAWSHERALQFIEESAGSQFDPEVVAAFLEMVADSGAGLQKQGDFAAAAG
jgi:putative nucleotidyltransferase with HDIG domain